MQKKSTGDFKNPMSSITNEPKIKIRLIAAIRELLEHRALWLYLLCDKAARADNTGMPIEITLKKTSDGYKQ